MSESSAVHWHLAAIEFYGICSASHASKMIQKPSKKTGLLLVERWTRLKKRRIQHRAGRIKIGNQGVIHTRIGTKRRAWRKFNKPDDVGEFLNAKYMRHTDVAL